MELLSKDETMVLLAQKVAVLDRTGAGNTFNMVFLPLLSKRYDLEHCVRFADSTVALVIQSLGTGSNLPTLSGVEDFVSKHQLTIIGETE